MQSTAPAKLVGGSMGVLPVAAQSTVNTVNLKLTARSSIKPAVIWPAPSCMIPPAPGVYHLAQPSYVPENSSAVCDIVTTPSPSQISCPDALLTLNS